MSYVNRFMLRLMLSLTQHVAEVNIVVLICMFILSGLMVENKTYRACLMCARMIKMRVLHK